MAKKGKNKVKARNWVAVDAHFRSNAGAHKEKEYIPCAYCGENISGRHGEFCSTICEDDARDEAFSA